MTTRASATTTSAPDGTTSADRMEDSAAAAGEGQRFKRVPRQPSCGRNLELDPLMDLEVVVDGVPYLRKLKLRPACLCKFCSYFSIRMPVDCISLSLSGMLFPWSAPALVISGINAGPDCGYEMFQCILDTPWMWSRQDCKYKDQQLGTMGGCSGVAELQAEEIGSSVKPYS